MKDIEKLGIALPPWLGIIFWIFWSTELYVAWEISLYCCNCLISNTKYNAWISGGKHGAWEAGEAWETGESLTRLTGGGITLAGGNPISGRRDIAVVVEEPGRYAGTLKINQELTWHHSFNLLSNI